MEQTYIIIRDRDNPHITHKVLESIADKMVNKMNKGGKRLSDGKPRFYIEEGSQITGRAVSSQPQKKSARNVVGEPVVTKTEWSDEQVIEFIKSTNTLMELDRLKWKLGGKYTKEIEAREAEIKASIKSQPFEKKEPEQSKQAKTEPKPKAEAKPKTTESKPKASKTKSESK